VIFVPPAAFDSANVAFEYAPFGQPFARQVCTIFLSFVSFKFFPSRSWPTFHLPPTRGLTFAGCPESAPCFSPFMSVP